MQASGLFFAIGHEPASKFLAGQLHLDADGYVQTKPGTTETNIPGVFAAGDVQDKKWRQAITAAGTGDLFTKAQGLNIISSHLFAGSSQMFVLTDGESFKTHKFSECCFLPPPTPLS